jgi:uncharacterized small protein (TIGR04563 family)
MADANESKQALYLGPDVLRELREESARLDRSMSWLVREAWRIARDTIRQAQPAPWRQQ